ncbi:MAG: hypothetical protein CMO80_05280 [Verrucomicrobiales bacterium]|nr:hypothetical protein [Verrucomicrobiales bacterium]|tara:strand:- start:6800 stop:7012 length:213 start_codon:yes stop_codon:yes gene_type:complete
MDSTSDERVTALESAVAHLERQYDELNGIVMKQDKLLTKLSAVVSRMDDTFRELELSKIKENNQRPPHYE